MTAPDYPFGEWSVALVGAQWVSITSVTALDNAIANRGTIQTNFSQLHDTLQQAITTTLAGQEGEAADAIRDAFRQGADQAAKIAEKSGVYKTALQDALNSVKELRDKLTAIANDGNKQINDELQSKDDFEIKVGKIAKIIADCQRQANQAAAECAFSIIGDGQKVVDAQGTGQSFFGMARDAGIDANQQPNMKAIEDQVRGKLSQDGQAGAPGGPLADGGIPAPAAASAAPGGPMAGAGSQPGTPVAVPSGPAPSPSMAGAGSQPGTPVAVPPGPAPSPSMAGAGSQPGTPLPVVPAAFTGGGNVPSAAPGPAPLSSVPSAPMGGMAAPAGLGGLNPTSGAPPGLNSGAPISAPATGGGPGLPGGPVQAMQAQVPPTAPTLPATAATPVTVGDAPAPTQAAAGPPAPSAPSPVAYTSEPASPMMAGPAAVAAVPPAPAGPLPAYGADLVRPTVAAPPSPPIIPSAPSTPSAPISQASPSTVPGSAPVHPSAGGTAGVGQPAVVRQPSSGLPTPAQSPPGVGTEGAIASAGGALAGAMSAEATARRRLQRLVAVVASQQPRLAWAVGDRADDTTVLVTDLASGWIPPGIEIPSAVTLLEPARRRGDLETLLGEVKLAAATEAGHYRPESDTDEPVPMSPRRRVAPEVEELSWQLSDATHFRDGLPRLAHTLARAASRGTGVLESEAEQLHDELTKLADRVLDQYPDNVDAADVGNWQLLAAIEALVNGDRTAANYHLAWFLACTTTAAESIAQ
jgi:hypothetical protein